MTYAPIDELQTGIMDATADQAWDPDMSRSWTDTPAPWLALEPEPDSATTSAAHGDEGATSVHAGVGENLDDDPLMPEAWRTSAEYEYDDDGPFVPWGSSAVPAAGSDQASASGDSATVGGCAAIGDDSVIVENLSDSDGSPFAVWAPPSTALMGESAVGLFGDIASAAVATSVATSVDPTQGFTSDSASESASEPTAGQASGWRSRFLKRSADRS